MGVCGSGAFIDFVARLVYGPRHCIDYMHVTHKPNGSKELGVYIRKETFRSILRKSHGTVRLYDDPGTDSKYERLQALKNLKDGINCDGHRIVPVNADGHVIMEDGTVYDRAGKQFLRNHSTEIKGYTTLKPRLLTQLRMICTSPAILSRLVVVLAISAIFDTGVYELGKYKGYREIRKGKVPLKQLAQYPDDHLPSNGRLIANNFSPIPLTLSPLLHAGGNDYVSPPASGNSPN